MDPCIGRRIARCRRLVHVVVRFVHHHRLAREVGREEAGSPIGQQSGVIEDHCRGMRLGEVERAARLQKVGDDLRPATQVGQPRDRAPSDEHHIECRRLGNCCRRVVQIGLNEARAIGEAHLAREPTGRSDRGRREIQSHDGRAALRQLQGVRAEMALKVEDMAPVDRPELRLFNRVQAAAPRAQAREIVTARAEMQRDLLVPMGAVGRSPRWFVHDRCSSFSRRCALSLDPPAPSSLILWRRGAVASARCWR